MQRRTFISTLLAVLLPGTLVADAQNNIAYEFKVSESQAGLVSDVLPISSTTPLKSKAGVAILLLAGVASLMAIAKATLVFAHQAKLGQGTIVDARGDILRVAPEPSLPPGTIVVRQPDGQVILETESSTDIGKLIAALLPK